MPRIDSIQFEIVRKWPTEDIIELYKSAGWWNETENARRVIPGMISGSFCFMIALDKGALIGMGRVISDGSSDGYIQDVVVKKEYRGLHIGKELLRRLTEFCVEKKLEWIGLIAEPNTQSFYEKIGFKVLRDYVPMQFSKE